MQASPRTESGPDPYAPPEAGDHDQRFGPPYFRAWLSFFVVANVAGALVGGIIDAGFSGVYLGANEPPSWLGVVVASAAFLASIPISFLAYRWSVRAFLERKWGAAPRRSRRT
ncbi:MAG: hypothetical protein R3F34_05000 [Planctomycetota bacterium]